MSTKPEKLFYVTGRGEFPMDMLRYDDCDFLNNLDQVLATEFSYFRCVRMKLVGHKPRLTPARWGSFGWTVVEGAPGATEATAPQAVTVALERSYDLNGLSTALSEAGADVKFISGHESVTGYELASRIALAKRRIAALQKGIDTCERLLNSVGEA